MDNLNKIRLKINRIIKSTINVSYTEIPSLNELPDRLENRVLYLIGESKYKWIIMNCPCGCNDRIDINLMKAYKPYWNLTLKDKRISLYPSLWIPKDRCGSHFWIINSKIVWAKKRRIFFNLFFNLFF